MAVSLKPPLKAEYEGLFNRCAIRPARARDVDAIAGRVQANKARYEKVGKPLGVPWYVVGVIHNMESSGRFDRHLHNGDPLTARTRQVPAGRPRDGQPPFTWEASAIDALRLRNLHNWKDWSIAGTMFQLEGFNGFGYRMHHPEVLSPYLWSFSNHYTSGKYVADGRFSSSAVSAQCGAAVVLRRLAEKGQIELGKPAKAQAAKPPLRYSKQKIPFATELQEFLNTLPGIFVKVDGRPGDSTSDAFKAATGRFLAGDPRAAPKKTQPKQPA